MPVCVGVTLHNICTRKPRARKNAARERRRRRNMKRMSALIGAAVIADGRRAGRVSGVVLEGGQSDDRLAVSP